MNTFFKASTYFLCFTEEFSGINTKSLPFFFSRGGLNNIFQLLSNYKNTVVFYTLVTNSLRGLYKMFKTDTFASGKLTLCKDNATNLGVHI